MSDTDTWYVSQPDASYWQCSIFHLKLTGILVILFLVIKFAGIASSSATAFVLRTPIALGLFPSMILLTHKMRKFEYLAWNERALRVNKIWGDAREYEWSNLTDLRHCAMPTKRVLCFGHGKTAKITPFNAWIRYDDYVAAESFAKGKLKVNARTP